jgi:hypothetical protein
MVQWIIRRRTQPGHQPSDMMLATGVAMAYYLCLRASEYASRTVVPRDDLHQFVSESMEFTCSGSDVFVPSHLMHRHRWSEVRNIRFTVQHAKYIKVGHGVPIWFSTDEDDTDAIAFLQLVYFVGPFHETFQHRSISFISPSWWNSTLPALYYVASGNKRIGCGFWSQPWLVQPTLSSHRWSHRGSRSG